MIKIYHNPRCSKSREALGLLEKSGKKFEVIKYLENAPTKEELQIILSYLGLEPIDIIRKKEAIWKEQFKNKTLSDDDVLNAMIANPKLIERPIVIKDKQAVIGRPLSNIVSLIK